jgi:septal ring factor EnvC (AmiA/AmiB activator)
VKGKRTYRIAPVVAVATNSDNGSGSTSASVASDFDYDELAGALLVQVAQSLRAADEPRSDESGWARRRIERLERRIDELERQLARAQAQVNAVTEDRDGIRRQFELSENNLALLAERPPNNKPRQASFENRLQEDDKTLLRQLRRAPSAERPEQAS